mmetsp:Transcript_31967/g.98585  ORF Transcript_31967/g.98585 Transcript_31967/m.98585 type:complete len:145 (-) Transcript_31967:255-689(-)
MGSTTASISSFICLSQPPMSEYSSDGFSSISIAFTRESYSAGNFSRMRYESLFVPTNSPGTSSCGSMSPGIGKYIVCLVDVRITTDFPDLRKSSTQTNSNDILWPLCIYVLCHSIFFVLLLSAVKSFNNVANKVGKLFVQFDFV